MQLPRMTIPRWMAVVFVAAVIFKYVAWRQGQSSFLFDRAFLDQFFSSLP